MKETGAQTKRGQRWASAVCPLLKAKPRVRVLEMNLRSLDIFPPLSNVVTLTKSLSTVDTITCLNCFVEDGWLDLTCLSCWDPGHVPNTLIILVDHHWGHLGFLMSPTPRNYTLFCPQEGPLVFDVTEFHDQLAHASFVPRLPQGPNS